MVHKILPQSKYLEPIEETSEHRFSRDITPPDQLHGDEDFNGPTSVRTCTDLPCLLAFIVMSLGFIAAAVYSKRYSVALEGDPMRTVYGYDFRGEICGVGGLKDKRFMYYPNPANLDFSLCVPACPYYYVRSYYCIYGTDHETCLTDYANYSTLESTVISYYCVPWTNPGRDQVLNWLYAPMWVLKRAAGDFIMGWSGLLIGLILALLIGAAHLMLFRNQKTVKPLAILSLLLSVSVLAFISYLFFKNYSTVTPTQSQSLLCGAYGPVSPSNCTLEASQVYYCLFGLTLLSLLFMLRHIYKDRKHWKIAVNLIAITGKPLHCMRRFFLFPAFQLVAGIGVITVLIGIFIYTLGLATIVTVNSDSIPGNQARKLEFQWTEQILFAFICLMCVLWLSFIWSIYEFVLSYSVSTWYFCREKSILYAPVFRAIKTCFRYHLGSIVYHSLISICTTLPILALKPLADFAYSDPKRKGLRTCLLVKFYEGSLKKYTAAVLPCLAVFGGLYGLTAEKALGISNRNFMRTGVPLLWGQYLTFCYRVTIAVSGAALTYGWTLLQGKMPDGQLTVEISLQPALFFLSLLLGFHCSFIFAGAIEISLKTVLFCASCDEEMFIGQQRFIEEELKSCLDLIAEEQTDQMREYALELKPAKKNKIKAMKEQDGVVQDEDWNEGILQAPRNPLARNNFRPIYQPGTPSTKGQSAPTGDQIEEPQTTMRANQLYSRPAEMTNTPPAILLTPASSIAWEKEPRA